MKVFRITLLLLLLTMVLPMKAQLRGYIIDEATGDSIPYASCIYRGHNVAVASNINGQFTIARHEGWVLTFSAVGYVSKSITITASTKQNFNVKLKPDTKALKEVVVKTKRRRYSRKNNPAVELMKKVVEAKKRTDLDNRDYYQYNKYQKITLALNNFTPETLEDPKMKKKPWLKDQVEKCEYNGKLILPVSVDETVTQKIYRKHPHSEKNIVKGQNSTGVNDLFQTGDILNTVLKDVFTDVNIYDDQIRLLQYPFTSPIGKDAVAFYRFYIMDTLYVERDKCIHLHFLPNNQQDFGFRGDIFILADGRCEGILQESYLVVVDIDIREYILEYCIENVSRLEEVVDSSGVLSLDDILLGVGMLAVDLLRDGLIHTDGQNEFAVVFAFLHLVLEPRFFLHLGLFEFFGSDIVECESEFLVFVILIVVAVVEVGAFLRLHHLLHQFDGRIVFPAISFPFRFYYDFLQGLGVGL